MSTDDLVAGLAARVGQGRATKLMKDGVTDAIEIGKESGAFDFFNRELVKSGLLPDAIPDIGFITPLFGMWMGRHLRGGIPLNDAIADLDIIAGTPLETLLEEAASIQGGEENVRALRVELRMMKAAMDALETCCQPGRVVEAATFIIRTTSAALQNALDEQPASS